MNRVDEMDVAEERRLDAFVGEAVGGSDAVELQARVLQRLRGAPVPRRTQWVRAALLLVGVAVVAGVAWLQRDAATSAAATQDPQGGEAAVAVVDNAALPPPMLVDVAAGADVTQEILRIAEQADASVLIDGSIDGKTTRSIARLPWREAIAAAAAMVEAGVEEIDGVLVVRAGARSLPYATRVTFGSDAILLRDFAKVLSARAGVDLVVAEDLAGRVRCDLKDASWRDALDVAMRQLGGEVVGCGSVLVLRKGNAPDAPRTTFSLRLDDGSGLRCVAVGVVADRVAQDCARNIVVGRGLANVSARVHRQLPETVLGALARATGGVYQREPRGIERLIPRAAVDDSLAVLTAENVDLRTFADLVHSAAVAAVTVPEDCARRLTVFASHAPLRDLLAAAALATGRAFVEDDKRGLVIE